MEKKDVVAFRNIVDQCTFTLTSRKDGTKKEFKPRIYVICDNSLNVIDDRLGSVIWDDDNERFWWFRSNTPGTTPESGHNMSMGSEVRWPYAVVYVDYAEIQNMRIVMNQESFDKMYNALGGLMTEEQKTNIEMNIKDSGDMTTVIPRKYEVNYVTGLPKKYDPPSKTEDKAYAFTVHANQNGAR